MIIKTFEASDVLTTNVYFYIDEKTSHGFLIDPAAEAPKLLAFIRENAWTIEKILITHGHFDHIGAVQDLCASLNVPFFAHENAKNYLLNSAMNLSAFMGQKIELAGARYFSDGALFFLEGQTHPCLKAFHTPGHTEDSVIYVDEAADVAFVGDTIFKNGAGRTDMPGGSASDLKRSLSKIFTLPDTLRLYPGHGEPTFLRDEKNFWALP